MSISERKKEIRRRRKRSEKLTKLKKRLSKATKSEQVEMARKVSRKTLREFLAQRSVELAGQSVRQRIRPEDDVRLIAISIAELRRGKG